jgi:hypothetical protein
MSELRCRSSVVCWVEEVESGPLTVDWDRSAGDESRLGVLMPVRAYGSPPCPEVTCGASHTVRGSTASGCRVEHRDHPAPVEDLVISGDRIASERTGCRVRPSSGWRQGWIRPRPPTFSEATPGLTQARVGQEQLASSPV